MPELSTNAPRVLIVSTDAVVAALLGTLVELDGYQPVFPARDEPAAEALDRTRPRIALVDCDDVEACRGSFFADSATRATSVILFSAARLQADVQDVADRHGLPSFAFPVDRAALGHLLRDAMLVLMLCLRVA